MNFTAIRPKVRAISICFVIQSICRPAHRRMHMAFEPARIIDTIYQDNQHATPATQTAFPTVDTGKLRIGVAATIRKRLHSTPSHFHNGKYCRSNAAAIHAKSTAIAIVAAAIMTVASNVRSMSRISDHTNVKAVYYGRGWNLHSRYGLTFTKLVPSVNSSVQLIFFREALTDKALSQYVLAPCYGRASFH